MRPYIFFYLGLILSFVACGLIFVLLLQRRRINKTYENRYKYSILMPALLTLLLLLLGTFELRPRVLDLLAIQANNLYSYNLESSRAEVRGHILYVDEDKFLLTPGWEALDGVSIYRLRFTPHTRQILEIEKLSPAEDLLPQETD